MTPHVIDCSGIALDLACPQVMGILNITPDSFSDGGLFSSREAALARAREMYAQGAAIIDVGGESTRPGAAPVTVEEELERVVPVIEAIRAELPVVISIDTSKPEVMRAATAAGAGMINDVRALREEGALEAARAAGVPVCLMHMRGEPRTMQRTPRYEDVAGEVRDFLRERARACMAAGIPRERLLLDPGFGFGKTVAHNFCLFKNLPVLAELGFPLLAGVSRKSFIGSVLDAPVEQRLHGSVAMAALAAWLGVSILRAHDVAATRDALKIAAAARAAC